MFKNLGNGWVLIKGLWQIFMCRCTSMFSSKNLGVWTLWMLCLLRLIWSLFNYGCGSNLSPLELSGNLVSLIPHPIKILRMNFLVWMVYFPIWSGYIEWSLIVQLINSAKWWVLLIDDVLFWLKDGMLLPACFRGCEWNQLYLFAM